jgi:hypothetical protein
MSRHTFESSLGGQPILVCVGYDRPTNEFFLHIGWFDPQTNSVLAYASELGLAYDPRELRSIRRFLDKLAIQAPESVWVEVAFDASAKVGNRFVRHLPNGSLVEHIW